MLDKRGLIKNFFLNNRGQVTIFIIIAIMIVAGFIIFFFVRQSISITQIPPNMQPIYDTFLSCLENDAEIGIDVMESQAGYIELPELEAGSSYMPFSSQLDFMGNPIPYWYYVSGNNIQKEQVPSERDMEESLGNFIMERARKCNLENYYNQGFEINFGEPKSAEVDIKNDNVNLKLNMRMSIIKGNDSVSVENHNIVVNSKIGNLYASAIDIYEKEKRELFLENYGIDILRLYAPVDGVKLSCSPQTWNADEVFAQLKDSIEANTLALSTNPPTTENGKYFYVDARTAESVRFINSQSWPSAFEVLPSEGNILIANPVGNQEGLGILGFCYVPYHFVYNVRYPVLIQIYNGEEIFQFPVAIAIMGNKPRAPLDSSASTASSDLCPYKNTLTTVKTYDSGLNPVDAAISYECFGESCNIGNTESGIMTEKFPQCVNGFIIAKAEGFTETRYMYSTTSGGNAELVLNKLYPLNVQIKLGNSISEKTALIYFSSPDNSQTLSYPQQKSAKLSEGDYELSVYVYDNASIQLSATTTQQCTEIPSSGIGGILGFKDKKCFDVNIPSQLISNVLIGGGKAKIHLSESELKNANSIEINADKFVIPKSVAELQNNYLNFDSSELEVSIR